MCLMMCHLKQEYHVHFDLSFGQLDVKCRWLGQQGIKCII